MLTTERPAPTRCRVEELDPGALREPVALIYNPHAGQKLGVLTNSGTPEATQAALRAAGVPFDAIPTRYAGHATQLAREAVAAGRRVVVAAGGDGTVAEVAHGLAGTGVALGIMPLGSIMNVARTLCIPRDLEAAARTIAARRVLAMDMGRVGGRYFLEAAGVGLDAGLFAYFNRLDKGGSLSNVMRGCVRFIRGLGMPRVFVEADGRRYRFRAPMVAVANSRFVGAAYTIAPDARIDDGFLDGIVFRRTSIPRLLLHLALVAGGRRLDALPSAATIRGRTIVVSARGRRPLPVHADGVVVGSTPARFEVAEAALRVLVGNPNPDESCAWTPLRD